MLEQLHAFFKESPRDALHAVREKGWSAFLQLGLPEKRDAFQYLPLSRIYGEELAAAPYPFEKEQLLRQIPEASHHSYFVFIDGALRLDLSDVTALPKSIVISDLSSAVRTYGTLLNNRWQKSLQEELDPFVHLNLALHRSGLFLYIPPKLQVEPKLHCLFVTTGFSAPRLQLFAGAFSEVNLVITTLSLGEGFCSAVVDLQMDDGSAVSLKTDANSLKGTHFHALRATLKRNSRLKTLQCVDQGKLTRYDAKISLSGEGAEAEMRGLWTLSDQAEAHVHILMDHQAPHTRSLQKFKGLLDDGSRSSFEGKILVQQIAQKTEAYQLNQNLLLGERAVAHSKPNLEIFADDVRASHGTTVSQLDTGAKFYLKTRGVSEESARKLLIDAFCQEMRDL